MNTPSGYFAHYSAVNDLSAEGRRSHWGYLDARLHPHLPADKNAAVLDIGCGAGIVLEWLSAQGYTSAKGIDSDLGQLHFARSLGVNALLCSLPSQYLRGSSECYELVVLKDVLEHCPGEEVAPLLEAICQKLTPTGILYVSVPNANASFSMRWRYNDPTHLRSYTEVVLRSHLERAGFEVVRLTGDDYWKPSSTLGLLRLLARALFRLGRRAEAVAEFGALGMGLVLSLNIVAIAKRS